MTNTSNGVRSKLISTRAALHGLVALLSGCSAQTTVPSDTGFADVGAQTLVAESIRAFEPTGIVDQGGLSAVAIDDDGSFVALGTIGRENPAGAPDQWNQTDMIGFRIRDATATSIPAPDFVAAALGGCDFSHVVGEPLLHINQRGVGIVAGTGMCARRTGPDTYEKRKAAIVARYENGALTPFLSSELPLAGAFVPVAVHCDDALGCWLAANRSPSQGAFDQVPTSITVLRLQGDAFVLELDEVATAANDLFEPRVVTLFGNDVIVAGTRTFRDTNATEPLMRIRRDNAWRSVSALDLAPLKNIRATTAWGDTVFVGTLIDGSYGVVRWTGRAQQVASLPNVRVLSATPSIFSGGILVAGEAEATPGYVAFATLVSQASSARLSLPSFPNPSSVVAAASNASEVILVGSQAARARSGENRLVPLIARIALTRRGTDDGVLTEEIRPAGACDTPMDCTGEAWNIRCSGHFTCVNRVCDRECDFVGCGDHRCDSSGGESRASCSIDCS